MSDSKAKLNEATVAALPVPATGNKITYFGGSKLQGMVAPAGFGVRVTSNGARSYILNYRSAGTERRLTIGGCDSWSAIKAVRYARELRQDIDRGQDPLAIREAAAAPEKTVGDVLDDWLKGHVRPKLRSAANVESAINRFVRPRLGKRDIYSLSKRDIAETVDHVVERAGPVQGDRVRAYLSSCLAWFAERDDRFTYGMVIVKAKRRSTNGSRERILSDSEIRAVWTAAGEAGTFGAICKLLLLTAARRCEVSDLPWSELEAGVWTLPASRAKNKRTHSLQLSRTALAVIEGQSRDGAYVFPCSTGGAFSAHSKGKAALDRAIAAAGATVADWTLHDLRRTARSLMARAGVRPDIAERVLNHAIVGVAQVYDRHSYEAEKGQALETLARMIDSIIHPAPVNVVRLHGEVA
jgi:integrase